MAVTECPGPAAERLEGRRPALGSEGPRRSLEPEQVPSLWSRAPATQATKGPHWALARSFLRSRLRPISSKAHRHKTQKFKCPLVLKMAGTGRLLAARGLSALCAPQNCPRMCWP